MLGLKSHPDYACSQIFESRNVHDEADDERGTNGDGVTQDAIKNPMCKYLKRLGSTNGFLSILLHLAEMMRGKRVRSQSLRQNIGCCDGVLECDVDAYATDW